jgi:hypothetical protein
LPPRDERDGELECETDGDERTDDDGVECETDGAERIAGADDGVECETDGDERIAGADDGVDERGVNDGVEVCGVVGAE